ncbi:sigma-70 family RNA polymerase sigma factor [Peribacillus sp. YIM B13472]|uniref:sigma-70 family RNA polymerase sigma factor n=1 Tax=Peribacillus sp. YIM B13472 TaxID=3366297 RepID=UPI00366B3525
MENKTDFDVDNKEIIIEDIMNKYSKDVYLLAYSFVRDQGLAEDISQEVFIKCYKNIEKFRRDASIKTWVYRITVNTSKDFIRKKSFRVLKYSKLFLENFKKSESSEEVFLKQNQNAQILHKVLSLSQKYREVVVLYYFQDLKVSEIGETLGINTNTVKTRLTRGRSILKENLIFEKGDALNG